MAAVPTVTFQNGVKMPIVGLGTWQNTAEDGKKAIEYAIVEAGYRLIDTAALYENEKEIGEVLAKLFKEGKLKREEIFVTTKVWVTHIHPSRAESSVRDSLKRLQLDFVDLLLVHQPAAYDETFKVMDTNTTVEDIWKGFEAIYDKGLTRAIGVSNFSAKQIDRIMKIARVPIHNHQVEIYLYWPQHELVDACKRHGISVTSYGSLGSPGRLAATLKPEFKSDGWKPAPDPQENEKVRELAAKYKKTPAQILLRYLIERDICVVPKSGNPQRQKENIDIFDFKLTKEEVDELNKQPYRQRIFLQEFMIGHPEDGFERE